MTEAPNPDLDPTPEARIAMMIWDSEYAQGRHGSMGFWKSISPGRKHICLRALADIAKAAISHGRSLEDMAKGDSYGRDLVEEGDADLEMTGSRLERIAGRLRACLALRDGEATEGGLADWRSEIGHPNSRLLFKRMVEKAGIDMVNDDVATALEKVAALTRNAEPPVAAEPEGVHPYWREGTALIEACLAKAVKADPADVPMPLIGDEAILLHNAQAEAYRHALEMMGVPECMPALVATPPAPTAAVDGEVVKALKFYADPENWVDTPPWEGDLTCITPKAIPVTKEDGQTFCDCGDVARAALKAPAPEAVAPTGTVAVDDLARQILSRLIYHVSTDINPRGWEFRETPMLEEAVRFLREDAALSTPTGEGENDTGALRAFAESFRFTVTDSFYKDAYLGIHEPDSVTIRLVNNSLESAHIAKLEARRKAALSAPTGTVGRDRAASEIASLRTAFATEKEAREKAEKALREAHHELSCCDDITLDKGLVTGISELQADRDRLRSGRRALDRTTLPPAEGWRPIDSAPKDGSKFLAYEKGHYFDCWWHENGYGEAYWMDEADSEPNPSDWMPLPSTPQGPLP